MLASHQFASNHRLIDTVYNSPDVGYSRPMTLTLTEALSQGDILAINDHSYFRTGGSTSPRGLAFTFHRNIRTQQFIFTDSSGTVTTLPDDVEVDRKRDVIAIPSLKMQAYHPRFRKSQFRRPEQPMSIWATSPKIAKSDLFLFDNYVIRRDGVVYLSAIAEEEFGGTDTGLETNIVGVTFFNWNATETYDGDEIVVQLGPNVYARRTFLNEHPDLW